MPGAAILGAFTLTLSLLAWVDRPQEADLSDLIAALPHPRPFVARLSGGFPYAPCERAEHAAEGVLTPICETPDLTPGETARLHALERDFKRYTRQQPEAKRRHLQAQASLAAYGTKAKLDITVHELETAANLEPENGAIYSDLALAHAARATSDGRPFDFVKALSAAKKAIELAPSLPEARFQYAEALTRFFLRSQAIPAWEIYLDLVPRSSDAYAEARLARLREPTALERWPQEKKELVEAALAGDKARAAVIVRQHPSGALEEAENTLLGAWAAAYIAGDQGDAARKLAAVRVISKILAEENGDLLALDQVELIEGVKRNEAKLRLLAEGHRAYSEGIELIAGLEYQKAVQPLNAAGLAFSAAQSPFERKAALQRGICLFYRPDYPAAEVLFERLSTDVDETRHPQLAAYSRWMLSLTGQHLGDNSRLIPSYLASLAAFERFRDMESAAAAHTLLAQAYGTLGQTTVAWHHWLSALGGISASRNPRRPVAILVRLGDAAAAGEVPEAAFAFGTEAVALAGHRGNAHHQVVAYYSRSQVRSQFQNAGGAIADLKSAWAAWRNLPSGTLREGLEADVLRAEMALPLEGDLNWRLASASRAIAYFQDNKKAIDLPEALAARARIYGSQHNFSAMEADLRAAVAMIEGRRQSVPEEDLRITYRAQATIQRTFDDLVRLLALQQSRPDRAFGVSESGRARALLDRLAASSTPHGTYLPDTGTLNLGEVQECLPPRTVLLAYSTLPERLLAWRVSRRGMQFFDLPLTEATLSSLVARFRHDIESLEPIHRTQDAGGILFDAVLRPVLLGADSFSELVIAPSGSLAAVPFPALYDRKAAKFLIETSAISLTPSATVFCRSVTHSRAPFDPGSASVLAVGEPQVDTIAFASLSSLPLAATEAATVAHIYPKATLLLGAQADHATFVKLAPHHEILHFSGHGIANLEQPTQPALALAPSGGSSGALYAHEIAGLRLPRTRLVMLSACRSAAGLIQNGEGTLSIGRAFLAAGASTVVATLWDLKDSSSVALTRELHAGVRSGLPVGSALRAAQIRLIHSTDRQDPKSLSTWAAFEAIM